MTLDQWLTARGMKATDFASLAGLTKQAVYYYRRNLRFPGPDTLRAIREATGGQVTADDFVDAHPVRDVVRHRLDA